MNRLAPASTALAAALALTPLTAAAQPRMSAPEPIAYTLRFPAPETHYVEVEAVVPAGAPAIDLMMAVWTPGSYLVREYERNVEAVTAAGPDGAALAVTKPQKNRWRIEAKGAPRVTVRYKVYGREMSVRTNWIEARFALLNGAPTFLTLAEKGVARPHDVTIVLPAAWKTRGCVSVTAASGSATWLPGRSPPGRWHARSGRCGAGNQRPAERCFVDRLQRRVGGFQPRIRRIDVDRPDH